MRKWCGSVRHPPSPLQLMFSLCHRLPFPCFPRALSKGSDTCPPGPRAEEHHEARAALRPAKGPRKPPPLRTVGAVKTQHLLPCVRPLLGGNGPRAEGLPAAQPCPWPGRLPSSCQASQPRASQPELTPFIQPTRGGVTRPAGAGTGPRDLLCTAFAGSSTAQDHRVCWGVLILLVFPCNYIRWSSPQPLGTRTAVNAQI